MWLGVNNRGYSVPGIQSGGGGSRVRWSPGHYIQPGENDSDASKVTLLNTIASDPNIVGIVDVRKWADVEGATQGSYNFGSVVGATGPNYIASVAASNGKSYILDIASRAFGGTDPTGIIPTYVISNNWYYSRTAGGDAVGAAVWYSPCMAAKTAVEQAFLSQAASNVVAISSDETVFASAFIYPSGIPQDYSVSAYLTSEEQRWSTLRSNCPQFGVIVYMNFLNGDTGASVNFQALFAAAAAQGGVFLNGGPDASWQAGNTGSATGYSVLSGTVQSGATDYASPAGVYGVLCGVQNAETSTTTLADVLAEFNGYGASYQQWYLEISNWGNPAPTESQLFSFLQSNPVTNTAYPSTWPT